MESTISDIYQPITKEGLLKAVDLEKPEKDQNKIVTKQRVIGSLAVVLAFGVGSNLDEVDRWSHFNSQGAVVIPYDGCDIDNFGGDEEPKQEVEESLVPVQSAARKFTRSSIDVNSVLNQTKEFINGEQQRFTMDQSGIIVAVHSPAEVQIDETIFAELFHAPLTLDEEYTHPQIRQLIACYRRDIIENKVYAGAVYHIQIAPPEYCIYGMRFQPVSQVPKCDAKGATLPEIELSFLGLDILNYNLMMLSTKNPAKQGGKAISATLLHESAHAYMSLSDQPLRLDPDEKLAKRIEEVTRENLYPNGVPEAITYP